MAVAWLAIVALALVLAGAVMVGPGLTLEQRAGGLSGIAAALFLVARLSRRRRD